MLFAEVHQKLGRDSSRAHDRAEDLLTSTAFQLLRYINPPQDGLLAVLARTRAVRLDAGRVVVGADRPAWLPFDGVDGFDLDFWPRWPGAGEPDVVVTLRRGDAVAARLVVEVKLDSPKSPRAGHDDEAEADAAEPRRPDQLWDYYARLRSEPGQDPRGLVYLTSHPTPPLDELRESLECCAAARSGDWLGWLSWCDVWSALRDPGRQHLPARDLAEILAAKGLKAFDGFHAAPPPTPPTPWRFFQPWFSPRLRWARPAGAQTFWTGQRGGR